MNSAGEWGGFSQSGRQAHKTSLLFVKNGSFKEPSVTTHIIPDPRYADKCILVMMTIHRADDMHESALSSN